MHGWETPSVGWPASICLKLESSLCHILCVQNDPTSTSVSEMSKWVVRIFGLQLPSQTFPPFERQDTCTQICTHTHTQAQERVLMHTHLVWLWNSTALNTILYFQSIATPRIYFKKVAIQKSYQNVFYHWMEVGISSESRRQENSITYRWNCSTQRTSMYRLIAKYCPINTTF